MLTAPESLTPSTTDLFLKLTQPWTDYGWDEETGRIAAKSMPALIPELREAVFGGMEATGGQAGFNARLPIAAGALDLYEAIDMEIAEAWACVFPNQIPNADTPERLLSQIVAAASPETSVTITVSTQRVDNRGTRDEHWWVERRPAEFTIITLMNRWCRQILEFFDPPRVAAIDHECLSCGEMWAHKTVDDEQVRYKVFVFIRDTHGNSTEARCLACGTSWGRDLFGWIAAQIGATE